MKFANVFSFLFFVNMFGKYFSQVNKTFGLRFLPVSVQQSALSTSTVEIQPDVKVGSTAGYSFCLTVNFMTWDQNCLISSKNIELIFKNYLAARGTGVLRNGKFKHPFRWENAMEISYTSWNTICAVYNGLNRTLNLNINGEQVNIHH